MDEESLFAAALDLPTTAERQAFLDEACGGDVRLRQRVERLLAADEHARGILHRGPEAAAALLAAGPPEPPLAVEQAFAGRYRLCHKLGAGGMGEVWVAEQSEPVQRRVALKVIRSDLDSHRLLARFDQERLALALMDHPHIAKIHDAGVASGRPYFVMELVQGIPITAFCDLRRLTLRQRLELMVPVCQAVQHAHGKGIIHRDLKPSNILVALYDGLAVPKVIDFGVAKATGPRLSENSAATEVGSLVGTLEYMSPEQADLNNLDIDTHSDVYALGVLLYELLTGSLPFPRKRLRAAEFTEMLRIIREEEPLAPSVRLSGSDMLPQVAAARGTDPKRLPAETRGELDWIVMKCLDKDPARRYQTADRLAQDLERYLTDQPVMAGPPSTAYRVGKFLRRNRGPVLAVSLVLLALVGGIVGTTIGLVRAEQARQDEAKRALGERQARETAEKRMAQVEKGIDMLDSIFRNLHPEAEEKEGRPLRAILGDRLDQAAAALDGEAVGDPVLVAGLQDRLGRSYLGLGHPGKAEALFTRALATRKAHLGPHHLDTLDTLGNLAMSLQDAGKLDRALPLHEESFRLRKATLGPDHYATYISMSNLAQCYRAAGKLDRALPLYEEALQLIKVLKGPGHLDTVHSMADLAVGYHDARKMDLALPLYEKTLTRYKALLPPNHPRILQSMHNLAYGYRTAQRLDLALPLHEEAFRLRKERLGDDHPDTLESMTNLADCYRAARKLDRALPLQKEAIKLLKAKKGPDHFDTLQSMNNLAATYWQAGQLDRSIPLLEEVYRWTKSRRGENDPNTLMVLANLGVNYKSAGRLPDAVRCLEAALTHIRQLPEVSQATLAFVKQHLVDGYEQSGQGPNAEPLRWEVLAEVKRKDGPESLACAAQLTGLGANLLKQKKYPGAEPVLRRSLAIREKRQPEAWERFYTQSLLGAVLLGQKKYAEAEPLLAGGYQGMKQSEKAVGQERPGVPARRFRCEALERLVQLYDAWDRPGEAARWRKELETLRPGAEGPSSK